MATMRTTTTQQSISEWEREENDGDGARRPSPSHLPHLPSPKQQSSDYGDQRGTETTTMMTATMGGREGRRRGGGEHDEAKKGSAMKPKTSMKTSSSPAPPKQQSTDDGDPRECNGQAGMNKKGKGR